jgi:hypothetical protein
MSTESAPRPSDHETPTAPAAPPPPAAQRPHRFSLLRGRAKPAAKAPAPPAPGARTEPDDALAQFASESHKHPPRTQGRLSLTPLLAILATMLALSEGAYIVWQLRGAAPPITGTLGIVSRPDGAELFVDGQPRGKAPVQLDLPAGRHELELRRGVVSRRESVEVTAGASTVHWFDLGPDPAGTGGEGTAAIELISDPPGARVSIDGRARGTTPLVLTDLTPGLHDVVLASGGTTVRRQVRLNPSTTAMLVTPIGPSAPPPPQQQAGWVRVESAVALDVYQDDRLIGTSAIDRIMLPAGSHTLRLVSRPLNYEARQTIEVTNGQTRVVRPELPTGTLSINALPWAEVWVNGERKGETPIGNLGVPIGQHDVVFRHPQFGEQRRSVTVTSGGIARVGVDLRR